MRANQRKRMKEKKKMKKGRCCSKEDHRTFTKGGSPHHRAPEEGDRNGNEVRERDENRGEVEREVADEEEERVCGRWKHKWRREVESDRRQKTMKRILMEKKKNDDLMRVLEFMLLLLHLIEEVA
ncbi:hypothetical protein PIB30_085603 [Stylosanthes scabra]|uniref:Uncharacterized protein n=1 Tax=Stylosanthes scabra TaxID=79078 RepID=A0ABU6RTS5_9FABA|nr:hypothetical protein [Stylosanthes scabra]